MPSPPADPSRLGLLCVVSGPSGSGKTTLCRRISDEDPNCIYSVSCTTRAPRPGEMDGRDYHFLDPDEFERRIAAGDLLEHAQVHGKNRYYGTLKAPVLDALRAGTDVVMDLDVQGAEQLRRIDDPEIRSALVDVFILPPDLEELKRRIQGRGPMPHAELHLRLQNALEEMRQWSRYQYTVTSGTRDADFTQLSAILAAERHRSTRLRLPPLPVSPSAAS